MAPIDSLDRLDRLRALMAAGVPGEPALQPAIHYGSRRILEFLLARGVDPNGDPRHQVSPVLEAVMRGSFDLTERLLKLGANADIGGKVDAASVFSLLSRSGDDSDDCLRVLLTALTEPATTTTEPPSASVNVPPLVWAASLGTSQASELVGLLLGFHADPNRLDFGYSALYVAVCQDDVMVASHLLLAGAIRHRGQSDELGMAEKIGDKRMVSLLDR